jgi:hypothetical protein
MTDVHGFDLSPDFRASSIVAERQTDASAGSIRCGSACSNRRRLGVAVMRDTGNRATPPTTSGSGTHKEAQRTRKGQKDRSNESRISLRVIIHTSQRIAQPVPLLPPESSHVSAPSNFPPTFLAFSSSYFSLCELPASPFTDPLLRLLPNHRNE